MDARAPYSTGTHAVSRDAFVFVLKSEVLTAALNASMMLDTLLIVTAVK
jgi:hypothetical protein